MLHISTFVTFISESIVKLSTLDGALTLDFISMMVSSLKGEIAQLLHIFSFPITLQLHEAVCFCIVTLFLVSCISNMMTLKQMKHKYV